jgi:hypothetical protein
MSTARQSFGLASIFDEISNQRWEYSNIVGLISNSNNPPRSQITRRTELPPLPSRYLFALIVR